MKLVQNKIPDVKEQRDIINGVNLLPNQNDGEVLHPLQLPQRLLFWEMAFLISSTSLEEKSFELELELAIAKIREFSLEDPEPQNFCEEHSSTMDKQTASQIEVVKPPTWFPNFWQIKPADKKQSNDSLELGTMYTVPELWEFSYKMHPNLQGDEFPFYIEVIAFKNGLSFKHRWFSISSTTVVNKSGISAITQCCDDFIENFNSRDIIYFYLDKQSIDSLNKVIIKSHVYYRFLEILEFMSSNVKTRCSLIDSKARDFPSKGNDQPKESLNVKVSRFELKDSIKGHIGDAWVKRFNSNKDVYRQTKTFISEPSVTVSKDLL